jgi:hypothetical protein
MEKPKTTLLSAKEWTEFVFTISNLLKENEPYSFSPLGERLDPMLHVLTNLGSREFKFLSELEMEKTVIICLNAAEQLMSFNEYKNAVILLEHVVSLCSLRSDTNFMKKKWYYDCLFKIAETKIYGWMERSDNQRVNPLITEEGNALMNYIHRQFYPDYQDYWDNDQDDQEVDDSI